MYRIITPHIAVVMASERDEAGPGWATMTGHPKGAPGPYKTGTSKPHAGTRQTKQYGQPERAKNNVGRERGRTGGDREEGRGGRERKARGVFAGACVLVICEGCE